MIVVVKAGAKITELALVPNVIAMQELQEITANFWLIVSEMKS